MATINVTTTKLDLNEPSEITFASATSSDTVYFDFAGAGDEKLVILAKGAGTLTLKKSDGIQGVVDVAKVITAEGAVRVDSGMFKQVTGTGKGKVEASVSANMSLALIQLP